ncbi:16809_t:CDS:2 [Funneliformis caledonium]|uniref:16809_t:CDS:1 n=1 Tax=Funneliformis caledonium TaxID=1117310 RepID=A0A9N9GJ12_9GLOM|nr:16809_t:CDS:2 [Funneliformis caledonium]
MSISQGRLEELEVLRTKLDVSFDMLTKSIQERHASRIGMNGIKDKAVSEMILKRKLTQKNFRKVGEDGVSLYPMISKKENLKRTNKNEKEGEDLKEDSKASIVSKKSKLNSLCLEVDSSSSDDVSSITTITNSKKQLGIC